MPELIRVFEMFGIAVFVLIVYAAAFQYAAGRSLWDALHDKEH